MKGRLTLLVSAAGLLAKHFSKWCTQVSIHASTACSAASSPVSALAVGPQVFDESGCDYSVEIYTEAPATDSGRAELEQLKAEIPYAVLQISTDLVWSWQMMATADVLVMSNSAFSISAALLNPNAFNVFFPGAQVHQSRIEMRHWHTPLDRNGTLSIFAMQQLKQRVGHPDAELVNFGGHELFDAFPAPFH